VDGFHPFDVLDVNGDNRSGLVAVLTSDDTLWRSAGTGDGTLATAERAGQGWSGYRPAGYRGVVTQRRCEDCGTVRAEIAGNGEAADGRRRQRP
jgi:hypothetical protein